MAHFSVQHLHLKLSGCMRTNEAAQGLHVLLTTGTELVTPKKMLFQQTPLVIKYE